MSTANSKEPAPSDLKVLLKEDARGGLLGLRRWWVWALLVLLAAGGWWAWQRNATHNNVPQYVTHTVARGDLVTTVSATGNLQPTNQVDVGSELSGTVEAVLVEENNRVKKGQVLARLDTSKLGDQVLKSRAALAAAQAQVLQMQATVEQSRASLARMRQVAEISGGKVPSKTELDAAAADLKRAMANETAARAAVSQAEATLRSDETNLGKATIRSPIDGIVLARKVEPGQTVAASLQTPTLFTLAENLTQMDLQVNVDEADVGQVRDGQDAEFTVDAYPNRRFPAVIKRIDYGSTTANNVVSYLGVLTVRNDDMSLRPGMTATADIVTLRRKDVLLVPNAALRFAPATTQANNAAPSRGIVSALIPRMPGQPRRSGGGNSGHKADKTERTIWVLRDKQPVAVSVKVGATDGKLTEIAGGDLTAGMLVITEAVSASK